METPPEDSILQQASRACISCKDRKTKCDRLQSGCSTCKSKKWICQYPLTKRQRRELEDNLPNQESHSFSFPHEPIDSPFPASLFLDAPAFHDFQLELPRASTIIPLYAREHIGDASSIKSLASEYFDRINWWPILCKPRFHAQFLNPLSRLRTDGALLIISMRILLRNPLNGDSNSNHSLYRIAKQFHSEIERSGVGSVQFLQASVLIALYEFAHGIYPAAFLSVGACARLGVAFGFDRMEGQEHNWIEVEERKRIWWAIFILDRVINVGNPTRGLATQDPAPDSILPIDDEAWKKGVRSTERSYTLNSPASASMGRFARFAQAAHLLGRVLRHASDRIADFHFHKQEGIQLYRTLRALVDLSEAEAIERNLDFCTQKATCYSAIIVLYNHGSIPREMRRSTQKDETLMNVAEVVSLQAIRLCKYFLRRYPDGLPIRHISPFLHDFFYRSIIRLQEICRETGNEAFMEESKMIKNVLGTLATRWKAAGAYLQIIEARELYNSVQE